MKRSWIHAAVLPCSGRKKHIVAATMTGAQHLADLILIVLDLVGPFLFLVSSVSPIDPPSGLPSVYGHEISD